MKLTSLMKLPIEESKERLLAEFSPDCPWRMLVKAPTGSGKSTGLPSILLDAGMEGSIVVVQPRRLAARMLAKRVASLRGGAVGGEVGYVVRFDSKKTSKTKIIYVTDGVMARWLEENPRLDGIGAVIFDEFHERRLTMDVALADCVRLQDTERKDLKLCVMSATLELAGLEEYLAPCRLVEAGGRAFPVDIAYQQPAKTQSARSSRNAPQEQVWDRCARAVKLAVLDEDCGNILIFLPGVYEIRRTIQLLENQRLPGWEICALYGSLKPEQQDQAVREGGGPRIIVSTNVAETSLTIPGVRTVIDAGVARIAEFDPSRGMDTLFVKKIACAAADQRAGRAGRVAPGKCIRLWSEADQGRRAPFEMPEVLRVDLTEVVLKLTAKGFSDINSFPWIDTPKERSLEYTASLLENLGAVGEGGITELGLTMAKMPLHPRMGRLLLASEHEGCVAEGIFAVSILQGEAIFQRNESRAQFAYDEDGCDFRSDWRAYESALAMGLQPNRCSSIGVSVRSARELKQSIDQLQKMAVRMGWSQSDVDFDKNKKKFSRAMLTAYSDQLAVRNSAGNLSCRVVGKRSGQLGKESSVKDAELFITTSMTEVGAKDVVVYLNGCVEVLLEDVEELFPASLISNDGAFYDEKIRRVINRQELCFKDLVITSKDGGEPSAEQAAALLAERVASGELKLKKWDAGVEQWIARLLCLGEWMPELELPGFGEEDRAIALEAVCEGALGYKQIKDKPVQPALNSWLSAGQHQTLDAYAPERITLANGASVKVKYEHGKPPHIALKVQRLYGVKVSPTIANGAVTVQIHICAPNQRPWQMTQDLASFWKSGFAQMKKDLAGRYPKHDWSGGGHC